MRTVRNALRSNLCLPGGRYVVLRCVHLLLCVCRVSDALYRLTWPWAQVDILRTNCTALTEQRERAPRNLIEISPVISFTEFIYLSNNEIHQTGSIVLSGIRSI